MQILKNASTVVLNTDTDSVHCRDVIRLGYQVHAQKHAQFKDWRSQTVKVGDVEQETDNINFRLQTDHSVNNKQPTCMHTLCIL